MRRTGDITMFGGSGVRTKFGGDIQMLTPGGKLVIGVEGSRTARNGRARHAGQRQYPDLQPGQRRCSACRGS